LQGQENRNQAHKNKKSAAITVSSITRVSFTITSEIFHHAATFEFASHAYNLPNNLLAIINWHAKVITNGLTD